MDIQWSYHRSNLPKLTCNGIKIEDSHASNQHRNAFSEGWQNWHLPTIYIPRLSIFDPDGYLPLNLERTTLTQRQFPFEEQLKEDIYNDFLAFLIVNTPSSKYILPPTHPFIHPPASSELFWFAEHGLALIDPWNISEIRPTTLTYIMNLRSSNPTPVEDFIKSKNSDIIPACIRVGTKEPRQWFRAAIKQEYSLQNLNHMKCSGRRVIISKRWYEELSQIRVITKDIWNNVSVNNTKNGWTTVTYGKCPKSNTLLHKIQNKFTQEKLYHGVAEWYLEDEPFTEIRPSSIAEQWREIIKLPYIPYDLDERREKLKHAYKKLAPYIKAHEELAKSKEEGADIDDDE
jgi:hypothetical protein